MILETKRLNLREMNQDDYHDLSEILQDPDVVYAYEHNFSNKDVQEWLDRQRQRYQEYGFGLWAVVLKETGEMIGQVGLSMQPYKQQEVLELGYLLKKRYWHQGYANEAALGCIQYAFDILKQDKVYAIIKADNAASIKVAKRIGMEKVDEFITQYYHGDMLHYLFCRNYE
ncbi:MAG: GNAT family N-acetyltransferase [Longibaculum sp.]